MTLHPGQRLGPYEILAPLGAGGMGEVWRAHDTRLDRGVAIKILPAEFAHNAQLRARFEREAKTISQLNHPNICTLYDVGRENGTDYLVMELVEGETLADRIARGPLPVGDVLRFGVQIAEALDRAHSAGIVHRDLKPGNIMITRGGAKLLDFGLAKSGSALTVSAEDATQHKSLTQEGTIVGTFQYMSPEQLEGADVDHRTDIFALGAVLYEMVTGRRAFEGKNKTSLIASIVGAEPKPISSVQPLAPAGLEHVVKKCLTKERDERWQSARDIAGELQWIAESRSSEAVKAPSRRPGQTWMLATAVAVTAAVAAAATAFILLRNRPADPPMVLSLALPPHAPYEFFGQAALSSDGTALTFVAYGGPGGVSLWLRELAQREARPLPETGGAQYPFWSPDGRSIGFFADGKLKRIAVAGGSPQTICAAPSPYGGAWNRDGVIVFGDGENPLYRVDAGGGTPRTVTRLMPSEEGHRWPSFLPDGDHFIFLGDAPRTESHHIKIGSLRDGSSRDLFQAVTNAQFLEPDYILFVRAGALLAQRFDVKALSLTGEPRVIAENVVGNGDAHHREFSASPNGRLLYRAARAEAQLTWVDRTGKVIETVGQPRRLGGIFHLSPDQQRIAFETLDNDGRADDVWMIDRGRAITSRLTFDPASDMSPAWSPDGTQVAFFSMRKSFGGLYIADVASPANATALADNAEPQSWVGDNIACVAARGSQYDIAIYSVKSRRLQPYLVTAFSEQNPALSPDGHWIAYQSNESGRDEVYVEEFPSHAHRRQVSNGGGGYPIWRADSRELFYGAPGSMLIAVDMTSDKSTPKTLFRLPGNSCEAAADGQRFLVDQPLDDVTKQPITVVTNWLAK
jgi:Tol biopolymer transport system component